MCSENVHRHHSCTTFKACLFQIGIFIDDGHRKPFQALLVDVYFVIFYFLSAIADCGRGGHSNCTALVSTILLGTGRICLYTCATLGHFCPQLSELSIISYISVMYENRSRGKSFF